MKKIIVLSSLVLFYSPLFAEEKGQKIAPVVVERPTHEQLAKLQGEQRAYKHKKNGGREIKPIVTVKKRSLIGSSTLLATGSHWTIVPKGSIIHIPARFKNKVVTKPQGKLQDWPVFLRENAGWIHLHSIPMKQAHGQEFLGEKEMKAYKSVGKMVIATCGGHPISVAPKAFVPPVEEADKK